MLFPVVDRLSSLPFLFTLTILQMDGSLGPKFSPRFASFLMIRSGLYLVQRETRIPPSYVGTGTSGGSCWGAIYSEANKLR